jgi:glutamine synthetase
LSLRIILYGANASAGVEVLCNDPACNLYGATAASAGAEVPFLRPGEPWEPLSG